tara:strand:- start:92 stop:202 length:111 start_codon:yes stop_codon:yes gene_type:complete
MTKEQIEQKEKLAEEYFAGYSHIRDQDFINGQPINQ